MECKKVFKMETRDNPLDETRRSKVTVRYVNWLETLVDDLEAANKKLQIDTKPCEHCEDYRKLVPLFRFCEGCGRPLSD